MTAILLAPIPAFEYVPGGCVARGCHGPIWTLGFLGILSVKSIINGRGMWLIAGKRPQGRWSTSWQARLELSPPALETGF